VAEVQVWLGASSATVVNDPDRHLWALNHIDPSMWIIAGETETSRGGLIRFRDVFGQEEIDRSHPEGASAYEWLSRRVEEVEPGADRLIFAPWLSGERAPVPDHFARGAFVGLSISHAQSHIVRAVMEGAAYHRRWICQAMEGTGLSIGQINAPSGGSTNLTWTQIVSGVIGRDLLVEANPLEAGDVGAALTVAAGMGVDPDIGSLAALVGIERVVEPRVERAGRYDARYAEYLGLYRALAPINRRQHDVP
jgi:sugar (pentulose or hexulose) kinase